MFMFVIELKFVIVGSVMLFFMVDLMMVCVIGCFECDLIEVIFVSIWLWLKLLVIFRLVRIGWFLVSVLVLFMVIILVFLSSCRVLFLWNSMFILVFWFVLIMMEVGVVRFMVYG